MNPTNEELAKWCDEQAAFYRRSMAGYHFPPKLAQVREDEAARMEAIASRLRIPEGHVALPGGEVVKAPLAASSVTADRVLLQEGEDCFLIVNGEVVTGCTMRKRDGSMIAYLTQGLEPTQMVWQEVSRAYASREAALAAREKEGA